MSDSSEDEDLSRFREAVDTTFVKLIDESRGKLPKETERNGLQKSERYVETSTHYNDVRVPEVMQNKIGAKISAIIDRNVEFVTLENKVKNKEIKGGVKLFRDSDSLLSCEEAKDTSTEVHNKESRNLKRRKQMDGDTETQEEDKVKSVVVSGEYVLSKEETKCWKSRRKEKVFKYKSKGKSNILTAIE